MRHLLIKGLTLLLLILGSAVHTIAQNTDVNLILTLTDGEEHVFRISETSRLYFEDNENLVIENGESTTSFPLGQIRKVTCAEITSTDENSESALQILPNPLRNHFVIKNLPKPCRARLFSLDGRLMKDFEASEGLVIDISNLSNGMYLLNIDGQTLKLMKL